MYKQQVMDAIKYSGVPEDVFFCEKILDVLQQKNKKFYYYSDFLGLVSNMGLIDPSQNVQRCLNILKSKRVGVLKQEYRYVDDDDVIYSVEAEDLQVANENGYLFLEWRNFPDPDYLSKVYIVFVCLEGGL
jgi:hypothetical protein